MERLLNMISCTKKSLKIQELLLHSDMLSDKEIIDLECKLNNLHLEIMDLNKISLIQRLKER